MLDPDRTSSFSHTTPSTVALTVFALGYTHSSHTEMAPCPLSLSMSKLYLILKARITFYIILEAMRGSAGNNFLTEFVPRLQLMLIWGLCAFHRGYSSEPCKGFAGS